MKSEEFKIVTDADRSRIAKLITTVVLSYSDMASKSNRYIAILTGNSQHGVRTVRKSMERKGTLGTMQGDLPELPRIPETTVTRLKTAIIEAAEINEWHFRENIDSPELSIMRQLMIEALMVERREVIDLGAASDVADRLDAASEQANDVYEKVRIPLSAAEIQAMMPQPPIRRQQAASTRRIAALPQRSEMLQ
ncbi:hypothetical protein [Bosea sp. 685]|uniref:hypothetical protein n=1 Tax=Bosea sp. 685 TaxID=3080057 RepID=UPI002892C2AE|nr:hypothetical protein [Bosea sp. 685]WNJ91767.1 hypothetical protein RMR04_05525 [Bosea sp. 685]